MKVKLSVRCPDRSLIIGLIFAVFSLSVYAEQWLVRIPESLQQDYVSAPVLYTFTNNDKLVRLDGRQDDLMSLFRSEGVKYISRDLTLAALPEPGGTIGAAAENSQDGLLSDGFTALLPSERQCDAVTVAVLDSGVDISHLALNHLQFVAPYNAITADDDVSDAFGHGTHVTGIIAANSSFNTTGACTSATIMPIRFLNASGGGNISDAIEGIRWAIDHGASIINHSWTVSRYSQALFDVMLDANNKNIVQVAAAGNSRKNLDFSEAYPARFASLLPGLISVANWDNQDEKLNTTSNFGFSAVDIAASGTFINNLAPNDQTSIQSGTSMSAPLVTATAAMIWQQNTDKTNAEIRAQILNSADQYLSLTGNVRQERKLNAQKAVTTQEVAPALLTVKRDANTVSLGGYKLDMLSEWRYLPATLSGQAYKLQPILSGAQQVVFANWDMPAGWFEATSRSGHISRFAFLPSAPPPDELQVADWREGKILTWRGSNYAEEYLVYRSDSGKPFKQIATVPAPGNQFFDTLATDESVYKVRQKYRYLLNDKQYTVQSDYSDGSSNTLLATFWKTKHFGTIPVGSKARFPVLVDSSLEGSPMIVADDPKQFVQSLDNDHILTIKTDKVGDGNVTLSVAGSDKNRTFKISVTEGQEWSLDYSDIVLTVAEEGSRIESLQLLPDNRILITGQYLETQAMLQLVSSDPEYHFDQPEILLNKHQSDIPVIVNQQTLSLSLETGKAGESFWLEVTPNLTRSSVASAASDDSRCFIASAIYSDQPDKIQYFRNFRDEYLLSNQPGKWFVKLYYHYSPKLVVELKQSAGLVVLVTGLLDTVFYLSQNLWLMVLALMLFILGRMYFMKAKL